MSARQTQKLAEVKAAVIAGRPDRALALIDEFVALAKRNGISRTGKTELETSIAELRDLAAASLRGTRQASEDIRAIVNAARGLQTYDDSGQRQTVSTTAQAPHRF